MMQLTLHRSNVASPRDQFLELYYFRFMQMTFMQMTFASNILDPIMFADDTKLILSHQNIKTLLKIFNEEMKKTEDWFKANKLFLNNRKTKYTLFHKKSSKDDLSLNLTALKIEDNKVILLYRTKRLLEEKSLKSIYFAYIHTCVTLILRGPVPIELN